MKLIGIADLERTGSGRWTRFRASPCTGGTPAKTTNEEGKLIILRDDMVPHFQLACGPKLDIGEESLLGLPPPLTANKRAGGQSGATDKYSGIG